MSSLYIGTECFKNLERDSSACTHVVRVDGILLLWDISQIRNKIFHYDTVYFVNCDEMNFCKHENVFEKCNHYPKLRHYIGSTMRTSLSNL